MAELELLLLGSPIVKVDGLEIRNFNTRKDLALLAYLAVTGTVHSREELAGLLWSDSPEEKARRNLRHTLFSLRKRLGPERIETRQGIVLTRERSWAVDVQKLRSVLKTSEHQSEPDVLTQTLNLYRGEFLQGFHVRKAALFEEWMIQQREELRLCMLQGLKTLVQLCIEQREYDSGLTATQRLLQLEPWSETAHRLQMSLLAQSGHKADALRQYEACRQLLADELNVEPELETVKLYKQIKASRNRHNPATDVSSYADDRPQLFSQTEPQAPLRHNLPRQLTSLIGREDDIVAIQRLLSEETTALLTLVGQGGVGKTRLAIATAYKLLQTNGKMFADGIWFVPLVGIGVGESATEQIAGAIGQAMQLSLSGAEPLSTQLLSALRDRQSLLILDNFEHLTAQNSFLLEVVQTAHKVKVMLTSRQQMQLQSEYLYPVSGLLTPQLHDVTDESLAELCDQSHSLTKELEDLGSYPSTQLFVARVQQRLPGFQLATQNQNNVAHLCQLLEGVPLGIELTAQLYVEQGASILSQLIEEIGQLDPLDAPEQTKSIGLDHLQTSAPDLPERQRSIRAVFAYSWQLLKSDEQDLLCHCAIFRGGFTREAILTVADGEGANLLALVTKSLVRRDSHDRYDLHELIRQYVIHRMHQTPAGVHSIALKHAAYFTNLLAGQEEKLLQQPDFHQTIQAELYNIRAAWIWCIDQAKIAELQRSVVCLFIYFRFAGQVQEAITLATQAMTSLRSLPKGRYPSQALNRLMGYLLIYAASAGISAGLIEESEQWLQEAQQIGKELVDPGLLGQIYTTLLVKSMLRLEYHLMVDRGKKLFIGSKKPIHPFYSLPSMKV